MTAPSASYAEQNIRSVDEHWRLSTGAEHAHLNPCCIHLILWLFSTLSFDIGVRMTATGAYHTWSSSAVALPSGSRTIEAFLHSSVWLCAVDSGLALRKLELGRWNGNLDPSLKDTYNLQKKISNHFNFFTVSQWEIYLEKVPQGGSMRSAFTNRVGYA